MTANIATVTAEVQAATAALVAADAAHEAAGERVDYGRYIVGRVELHGAVA